MTIRETAWSHLHNTKIIDCVKDKEADIYQNTDT